MYYPDSNPRWYERWWQGRMAPQPGLHIMNGKSDKDFFSIPKKAMLGIAPAIAIIAVLLAKGKAPEVLLFLVGISAGVVIGMGFQKSKS